MPPLHFRALLGPAGAQRRQFHRGRGCVATIVPVASTSSPLTDTVPASIPMIHSFLSATPSRSFHLQALFTITCRPDFTFQQRFHTCNQCSQSVPNLLLRTLEGFTEKSMIRTLAVARPTEDMSAHLAGIETYLVTDYIIGDTATSGADHFSDPLGFERSILENY